MAGSREKKKFKDSKIPKKGEGKAIESLPIFKEPNNKSEIIGTIQKGESLIWISKSICDDCEWIRLRTNFGYVVGYDKSGKCNLDIESIKETKIVNNNIPKFLEYKVSENITKEDMDIGIYAKNEILNELLNKLDNAFNTSEIVEMTKFLELSTSKIDSLECIKFVWKNKKVGEISLKEARSLTCKINSAQLCNQNNIKKFYAKFGIVTSTIDSFTNCVLIITNDKLNIEEKIKDVTKNILGTAGSIGVGIKTGKTIEKISKCIPKFIKILQKTSKLSFLAKFTPLGFIGGFAFDSILSYLVTNLTEDITESIIQKIYDIFH